MTKSDAEVLAAIDKDLKRLRLGEDKAERGAGQAPSSCRGPGCVNRRS